MATAVTSASSTFIFLGQRRNREPLYAAFNYVDNQSFNVIVKDYLKDFLMNIKRILIG